MKDSLRNVWCLTAAATLFWATAATAQGLYWETTTTGIGTQPRTAQISAVPKMMKIVQKNQTVIVHSDNDTLITLDTAKRTYHEISIAGFEGAARDTQKQMDGMRAQMAQRMKDLPPEQRAMMEKMMPKLEASAEKNAPVTVSRTDETKTINGFACTKYVAKQDDKVVLVAWVTNDVKGFAGLHEDWVKFQKRMSTMSHMGGAAAGGVSDAYAQIEGFPIATEIGPVKTEVTKVEVRSIPGDEFQVPAGYTLEPLKH
jgi:hypothetical protein